MIWQKVPAGFWLKTFQTFKKIHQSWHITHMNQIGIKTTVYFSVVIRTTQPQFFNCGVGCTCTQFFNYLKKKFQFCCKIGFKWTMWKLWVYGHFCPLSAGAVCTMQCRPHTTVRVVLKSRIKHGNYASINMN